MADASHLERMGRELKCPICLGLLNFAVSLTCNHFFCNHCIQNSMKSDSNCPVCKVPYARREVRRAPQMDNLVNVYKNMEIASGFYIFVSQNARLSMSSDVEKKSEEDRDTSRLVEDGCQQSTVKQVQRKGKKKSPKQKPRRFGREVGKPSIATNKRVQVPESSLPETPGPLLASKLRTDSSSGTDTEQQRKRSCLIPKWQQLFRPFSWLSEEEDLEKLSRETDFVPLSGTPMEAPAFSDIKDSADDAPAETTLIEVEGKANDPNLFDSEMFEWTQRAGSPELSLTPVKLQLQGSLRDEAMTTEKVLGDSIKASTNAAGETKEQLNQAKSNRSGKKVKRILRKSLAQSKTQTLDLTQLESIKEVQDSKSHKSKKTSETLISFHGKCKEQEVLDAGGNSGSSIMTSENSSRKYAPGSKSRKRVKFSSDLILQETNVDKNKRHDVHAKAMKKDGPTNNLPHNVSSEQLAATKVFSQTENVVLRQCRKEVKGIRCAFCGLAEETKASGEILHYLKGRPVSLDYGEESGNIIHAHKSCTIWAPNVYFEDDIAVNLEAEIARSRRIKCSSCEMKGAALGCYDKSCRKSFHVTCAKKLKEIRWDKDNFVILCPLHFSTKLPSEVSGDQAKRSYKVKKQHQDAIKHEAGVRSWRCYGSSDKVHLCCSALTATEKEIVAEFKRQSGAVVMKSWNSKNVTHVIVTPDENGAYKRTLKVLMGILEGKWILNVGWIKACLDAKRLVDEAPYEIKVDIHGIKDGPRLGRLRYQNKEPKLFSGFKFYLTGDMTPSYKGYLLDLIVAGGGAILHRKPVADDQETFSTNMVIIIYSVELSEELNDSKKENILKGRRLNAEAIARKATGCKVASNQWVLDSISGYKLQPL